MNSSFQQAINLLSQGKVKLAEEKLHQILQVQPDNIDSMTLLGRCLMMQARYDEAISVFKNIIKFNSRLPLTYVELASAYLLKGEASDAEKTAKHAVEIDSTCNKAWQFLGNLYRQRGLMQKAKDCFTQAALNDPFREQFKKIFPAIQQKKFQQVEKMCLEVLKQDRNHPQALYALALVAELSEQHEEAVQLLTKGLKFAPFDDFLWERLVINFAQCGQLSKAIETAKKLLELEPKSAKYHMLLASQFAKAGRYEESLRIYNKAIILAPEDATIVMERGHVLRYIGKRDECEAAYRKSLTLNNLNGEAFWALAHLKSHRFSDGDKRQLECMLENRRTSPAQASMASFSLAKYYEEQHDYQTAFKYYQKANLLKPDVHFKSSDYQDLAEQIQHSYSKRTVAKKAMPIPTGPTPIFIVGMTRSGSTLIEQILASHSSIEGTMELYSLPRTVKRAQKMCEALELKYPYDIANLDEQQLSALGQSYLDETAIYRTDKPFFIDKLPFNFFYIGFIRKVLPQALIIDARRHPLATGISNYRQHFSRGYEYSYNLKHIGQYYNIYLQIMDYWNDILPHDILCVQYENMINETEKQIQTILNYCKLPFEENCLKFYQNKRVVKTASSEQVRQPINQDGIQQWRHFEKFLDPLKEALGKETLARFSAWS